LPRSDIEADVNDAATINRVVAPRRAEMAIRVRGLVVGFGDKLILRGLDLDVRRGEVLGFVGGSGTGNVQSPAHR
jgi:ABC-type multidrug transport system fused ATPase/permease subunit